VIKMLRYRIGPIYTALTEARDQLRDQFTEDEERPAVQAAALKTYTATCKAIAELMHLEAALDDATLEQRDCILCNGTGAGNEIWEACPRCNGSAYDPQCWKCDGTGQLLGEPCNACGGSGYDPLTAEQMQVIEQRGF
jgi:DnaJ-class molecular chaperone